jgi:hypothetical protein
MKAIIISILIAGALCNFLPIKSNQLTAAVKWDFYDCGDGSGSDDGLDVKYVTISQKPAKNTNNNIVIVINYKFQKT